MRRGLAVIAIVSGAACQTPPEPERVLRTIVALRYGMAPGLTPAERPSSQAAVTDALARAGARVECGGDSSNELGVYHRGCVAQVELAGCATSLSASFTRYELAAEDGVPGLEMIAVTGPRLGDCGPQLDRDDRGLLDPPLDREPWAIAVANRLDELLGPRTYRGAERHWQAGAVAAVLHDAQLAPCRGLELCTSELRVGLR